MHHIMAETGGENIYDIYIHNSGLQKPHFI